MKLKKLEINGFKSFDQKTSIEFPPGVSAVVGPNGCGKSNLVDAIRWVMGEQSVKQLRGKSMEDIIFSGANGKPPLNMAEVSLTLINDNGSAPEELKDFSEIMLTRRLYRSGESAYLINKQPCRLKDIHNVFLGSGLGAKSYAVIQQGNIGAITEAGPDERRYFIEEAAGVTRYINRKNEALRKVQSTNQNLVRITDIINEVNRQMNSLKRQARKAELYNKYKALIKRLDIRLALHYFDGFTQKINETETLIRNLKDTDIEQTTQLKKLDAAIEEIKHRRWQKNQEISDQKNHKFDIQRRLDRSENDLTHFRKDVERLGDELRELESARGELEQKNQRILLEIKDVENQNTALQHEMNGVAVSLDQEIKESQKVKDRLAALNFELDAGKKELMDLVAREAQFKNIYQNTSNNQESLKNRLRQAVDEKSRAEKAVTAAQQLEVRAGAQFEALKTEMLRLTEEIGLVKRELDDKAAVFSRQVKTGQTLEFERNKINSQYTALKKMEENFDWYKDGVKAVMKRGVDFKKTGEGTLDPAARKDGVIGLMADVVEPEPSYETAVEAALGESLQYVLVQDQAAGSEAIQFLQTSKTGRSGFVPLASVKTLKDHSGKKPEKERLLLNHVSVKTGFENIAEALLGHVVIADNIEEALAVFNKNGVMQTIVTKNGDIISTQGIMIGGSKENLSGILHKKQEIRDLKGQISAYDCEIEKAANEQMRLESEVKELEMRLHKLTEIKYELSQKEIEAEKALYKATEELKHARRHLEIVRLEHEQLVGEESDIEEQLTGYHRTLSQIADEVEMSQRKVASLTSEINDVSSQLETTNQQTVEQKLKLTSLKARLENSNNTLKRLTEFQHEGLNRLEQVSQEINQKTQKRIDNQQQINKYEQMLAELYEDIKRIEQDLERNESDYLAIDGQLKENDGIVSKIQNKREETLQKIRLLELELSQQQLKQENIINRIEDQYRQSLTDLRSEFYEKQLPETPADMPVEEMEQELSTIKDKIAKIVDVNLSAIKEFEEHKERFDFLSKQRDDLVDSIEDLHKVIAKINKITKKRFLETFDQINAKLNEVFPRLFEGGSAKLELVEPEKPLESGVEFMVHPPGKKLTRLSLLSGGEKALSAIAFIFSIFLIKPASFCLMDEIDAPLDEVNIFRFNDLLKIIGEKSQIVMITHNKKSMEFADTLFGVTMENKGVSKIVSVSLN